MEETRYTHSDLKVSSNYNKIMLLSFTYIKQQLKFFLSRNHSHKACSYLKSMKQNILIEE